jgi:phosphoesterase RecJ-like protein
MLEAAERLIRQGRRFVLTTHVNPDGDGVGSQVALWHFLRSRGKEVWIVNNNELAVNLRFLEPPGGIRIYEPERDDPLLHRADAVLVLDNSAPERLDRMREAVLASPATKICIDHHPDPDEVWDLLVIRETACATGEIVHELIRRMGGELNAEMATALYTAVVTDTGHFRFSNTRPSTHRLAAELVEAGVSVPRVYEEVYEQSSPAYMRLLGAALEALRLESSGRLGILTVTRELMARCGAEDEDTSEIINTVLGIAGVRLAVLLKELSGQRTKVSLRSKGRVDVNRLARRFGGGGHRNASGAVIDAPLDSAMPGVLEAARSLLEEGGEGAQAEGAAAPPA